MPIPNFLYSKSWLKRRNWSKMNRKVLWAGRSRYSRNRFSEIKLSSKKIFRKTTNLPILKIWSQSEILFLPFLKNLAISPKPWLKWCNPLFCSWLKIPKRSFITPLLKKEEWMLSIQSRINRLGSQSTTSRSRSPARKNPSWSRRVTSTRLTSPATPWCSQNQ